MESSQHIWNTTLDPTSYKQNPYKCGCGPFMPPEKWFGKDGYPTKVHYERHVKKKNG